MTRLVAACALATSLLAAPAAIACGGLFCSVPQGPVPPQPIDQNAERIIFDVGDGEVTTHVQIQYAGAADAFAWIVPVSAVPTVEESSSALFDQLEQATAVQVILPAPAACPQQSSSGRGLQLGCGSDSAAGKRLRRQGLRPRTPKSPVTIFARLHRQLRVHRRRCGGHDRPGQVATGKRLQRVRQHGAGHRAVQRRRRRQVPRAEAPRRQVRLGHRADRHDLRVDAPRDPAPPHRRRRPAADGGLGLHRRGSPLRSRQLGHHRAGRGRPDALRRRRLDQLLRVGRALERRGRRAPVRP